MDIMHVSCKESLEKDAYRLKGVVILSYEALKKSRCTSAPSTSWKEMKKAFIDNYQPLEN